jgi:membrane-associated phospholipid phosphatase
MGKSRIFPMPDAPDSSAKSMGRAWNRSNAFLLLAYWLGCVVLLLLLAQLTTPPSAADREMLAHMSEIRSAGADALFRAVTWLGSLYLLLPLTVAAMRWLRLRGRTLDAWRLGLSLAGAAAGVHWVKVFWAEPRPDLVSVLVPLPTGFSFPSAHAAQIAAVATAAFFIRPPFGNRYRYPLLAAGVLLAGLVAVSRIYLQVHYPADVVAGAAFGVYWVLALESRLRGMA